jgi:hypothetical protein
VFEESWGGAARAVKAAAKPAKWTLDAAVTPQELMAQSDKLTVAMQLLQDLHSEGHRCAEQAQCSELQTETVEVQNDCLERCLQNCVHVHCSVCLHCSGAMLR